MIMPMLLIALLIKLTSSGPVLYWSDRVGQDNRTFREDTIGNAIYMVNLATGERLWSVFSEGEGVVPSPAYGDGLIFTASGFGKPTLRTVRPGGSGDVTKTNIAWEQRKGSPAQSSLLYVKPHLYTFGKLAFFDCGGVRLFLEQGDGRDAAVLYFRVPDIRAAHTTLQARGVEFEGAPHLIHRHADGLEEWMAFFHDNEGRVLALMSQVQPV